jgi:hypothetical protein
VQVQLSEQHAARARKPRPYRRVVIGLEVGENFRSAGGANVFRIDQVLERNRNAMERSAPFSGGNFGLGFFRRFRASVSVTVI